MNTKSAFWRILLSFNLSNMKLFESLWTCCVESALIGC